MYYLIMDQLMKIWIKRISIVIGLVILLLLVTDFNSRMAELTRLRAQHEIETQRLAELKAENEILKAELTYASSDLAVEAWAREQGRLVRKGDYPIYPVPVEGTMIESENSIQDREVEQNNIEMWMLWLFGSAP